MSRARSAAVRFYFDADVLGLAHVVAGLRSDATYPGDPGAVVKRRERPACLITDVATRDDVWIPRAASLGYLIITRDSRIQQHRDGDRRGRIPLGSHARGGQALRERLADHLTGTLARSAAAVESTGKYL